MTGTSLSPSCSAASYRPCPAKIDVAFVDDDWIRPAKSPVAVFYLADLLLRMRSGVAFVRAQLAHGNKSDLRCCMVLNHG